MIYPIVFSALSLLGCTQIIAEDPPPPCLNPLTVHAPDLGAWIEADNIQVQGVSCEVDFIEIQGTRMAPQADGTFSAFISLSAGINSIEVLGLADETVVAMERFSVLQGSFGEPGALMSQSLHTHLSQAGVNAISELVIGMFTPEDVNAALEDMNPLFTQPLDFGAVLDTQVHVNTMDFSRASLVLTLKDSRIGVELRLADLHLWGRLQASYAGEIKYDEDVEAYAELTLVSGYLNPSVAEGELKLDSTEVESRLEGFGFDVSGFSDWIEENVLTTPLEGLLENVAVESIETLLVPSLETAFSRLAMEETVDILDVPIALSTAPALVEVDHTGMLLALDMAVSGPGGAHESPMGPLQVPSTAISQAENEVIGIGLHDNALNGALHALWAAGAFDMHFTTSDETLTPIVRGLLEADDVHMELDFQLPPVLTATPEGLILHFGEILADLQTPNGVLGETATVAIDGKMKVNAQFVEGEFTIDFDDIQAQAIVRENDWGMDTVEATTLFRSRLPMSMALSMMGGMRFPIPSLSEFGISQIELSRSGAIPETVFSLK